MEEIKIMLYNSSKVTTQGIFLGSSSFFFSVNFGSGAGVIHRCWYGPHQTSYLEILCWFRSFWPQINSIDCESKVIANPDSLQYFKKVMKAPPSDFEITDFSEIKMPMHFQSADHINVQLAPKSSLILTFKFND